MKMLTRRRDVALLLSCACVAAALAGCTGAGYGGTGPGPTPTPPIPSGVYYVNAGLNPNSVYALSSAPVAGGGQPSMLIGSPFLTASNGASGAPFGIALAKGGTVLYVVDADAAEVTAFPVNADGTLGVALSTVSTTGNSPAGICVDPSSSFAAVVNTGTPSVELFTIAASNGALTAVNTATTGGLTQPVDCAFSSDSNFLYVTNSTSGDVGISGFSRTANTLTMLPGSPFKVNGTSFQGIAIANGVVFAASQPSSGLGIFQISVTGVLINPSFFATATAPIGLALTPNGKSLYVAAAGQQAIDGYAVNGTVLTRLAGAPYATFGNKTAVVSVNGAGTLLVALDELDHAVTLFAVKSDGTLGFAPQNEYVYGASGNPMGVVAR